MSQRKMFGAQIKSIDTAKGLVTSVVAVFKNVDLQGDRILPGAFDRSITKWKAKMAVGEFLPVVWGHQDHSSSVIGKVIDMRETSEGLEVEEQLFLHKPAGKDAFDLMSEGVLPGSSFAYDIIKAKRAPDGVQDLHELDLIEVGPTIYPANPETRLVGVKADALDDPPSDVAKSAVRLSDDMRLAAGMNEEQDAAVAAAFGGALSAAFEKAVEAKVGRELSSKNSALIRQMHDVAHQLLGMPDHAEGEDKTEEPDEAKVDDPPVKAEVRAHLESVFADSAA